MNETKYENERRTSTPRRRSTSGFTLTELLAVIAIIGIVSALAFATIIQIHRNAQQAELDGTAKEIYIAAQNHLTAAESQNLLERKTGKGDSASADGIYYFAVAPHDDRLDQTKAAARTSVLYEMLPFGSLDETVRTEGTYVIEYDLKNAAVLGVFYVNPSMNTFPFPGPSGFSFASGDETLLFENPGYTGDDKKDARRSYAGVNGTVMVGYYGGDGLDAASGEALEAPNLTVENAERLMAIVADPNHDLGPTSTAAPSLNLVVTGVTSGKSKVIQLVKNGAAQSGNVAGGSRLFDKVESSDSRTFYVYLDDVTEAGGHFADIFGPSGLIPGEDVQVQAVAFSTQALTNVARSQKVQRNSLFASLSEGTAKIADIRHLENLSTGISSFSYDDVSVLPATDAEQEVDLSWTDFRKAIALSVHLTDAQVAAMSDEEVAAASSNADAVRVYDGTGNPTPEGTFLSATPGYALDYDGLDHCIYDISIDASSDTAGLFGSMDAGSVQNLALVNFKVKAQAGDAGALAGSAWGTSLSNLLAINGPASGDDAAYEISASGTAGGLVGTLSGGSMNNCTAALYVRAGDTAGGLAGSASSASIANCYSGGHTSEGSYRETTDADVKGRMNVIAGSTAGGLVGASASTAIKACYSTCSASGSTAGGLAGAASGGSFANCYAIGLTMGDTGHAGALAGISSASLQDCRYLKTANEDLPVVGSGSGTATAADADLESYAAFFGGSHTAYPYDSVVMSRYRGGYPYPVVSVLADEQTAASLPAHAQAHYGDWPTVETLVVNVRG